MMLNTLLKKYSLVLFLTVGLLAQESTMEFNGTTTVFGDITVTYSTGDFTNLVGNTYMDIWSGHPWASGIDGGGDYCDISISPATYIVSITVPYEINIEGFVMQFRNNGSVIKELTGFNSTGIATSNTYFVGAVADVIRFYDLGYSSSGGIEVSHITFNASMPVELTSFSAEIVEKSVVLNWETATEVNNYGFNVECRIENGEWETLGFVHGHGTTNSPKDYSFTDTDLHDANKVSYRLKQIDNDGKMEYSKIVTVDLSSITSVEDAMEYEFGLEQNYPNPFNPATSIKYQIACSAYVTLKVYDMLGKEVASLVNEREEAGKYEVVFDGSHLASGMYVYKLQAGNYVSVKKLMLMK